MEGGTIAYAGPRTVVPLKKNKTQTRMHSSLFALGYGCDVTAACVPSFKSLKQWAVIWN